LETLGTISYWIWCLNGQNGLSQLDVFVDCEKKGHGIDLNKFWVANMVFLGVIQSLILEVCVYQMWIKHVKLVIIINEKYFIIMRLDLYRFMSILEKYVIIVSPKTFNLSIPMFLS
jgi:hypothetical protein